MTHREASTIAPGADSEGWEVSHLSYVALYREWRPLSFAEVVGQEHITRTLTNAVRLSRLGHAYLFAGPRGTGKTSIAKILAKAANCTNLAEGGDPCNQCPSCQRINSGTAVDVLEIDAASNRGIDEIRDLRDKVKYAPAESRRKVYIIDEVHMLTNEAFNALLKTLEEPPAHALFILATTDLQKVPLTVLSRCQRFDFHRHTAPQIEMRLREVAERGELDVDERALSLVARAAEGGMRDALSLMDQLVAFSGKVISLEDALAVLGLAPSELLAETGLAVAHRDATAAFRLVDQVVRQGKDIRQFLRDLMGFLRNALLLQVMGGADAGLLEVVSSDLDLLQQVSAELPSDRLPGVLAALAETENDLKWSSQPRLLVELTLVKLCAAEGQAAAQAVGQAAGQAAAQAAARPAAPEHTTAEPAAPPPQDADHSAAGLTLDDLLARWPQVLEQSRTSRPLVYQMLSKGTPVRLKGNNLHVQFPKGLSNYDRGQMTRAERRAIVEEAIAAVLGVRLTLVSELEGTEKLPQGGGPGRLAEPAEDPDVKRVTDFFGGEVVEIRQDR
ncbi:MAG: DNA polymerase III subunit gamma/tau [Symbiobacteriia bacterium]